MYEGSGLLGKLHLTSAGHYRTVTEVACVLSWLLSFLAATQPVCHCSLKDSLSSGNSLGFAVLSCEAEDERCP